MKLLLKLIFLFFTFSSKCSYADDLINWTKLEITAELPAPYLNTTIAFLTTEQNNEPKVSQVKLANLHGNWEFTSPELFKIPIDFLKYNNGLAFKRNCIEFQQDCISFIWLAGEPQYLKHEDGTFTGYYLHVYLKITEQGIFNFKVIDMYQEQLKLQEEMHKIIFKPDSDLSVTTISNDKTFSFPPISLPKIYYGSQKFYYKLPFKAGVLSITKAPTDGLSSNYKLGLPSGVTVDLSKPIKGKGLHLSETSQPLVSVDEITDKVFVTIPCLLDGVNRNEYLMAAKFTISKDDIISTVFSQHVDGDETCVSNGF